MAIDIAQMPYCTYLSLVEHLDLGHAKWDHTATAIQLTWKALCSTPSKWPGRTLKYDPHRITGTVTATVLESYAPAAWCTDIEQHVAGFSEHIQAELCRACPSGSDNPKKLFFDENLWGLRRGKLRSRKAIKLILSTDPETNCLLL